VIFALQPMILSALCSSTKHILGGLSALEIIRRMSVETDHLLSPSESRKKEREKQSIKLISISEANNLEDARLLTE